MVSALERVPQSYGRERTLLFLKSYEEFDRKTFDFYQLFGMVDADEFTPSYDNLAFYLAQTGTNVTVRLESDDK